jgi:hypothetical protein
VIFLIAVFAHLIYRLVKKVGCGGMAALLRIKGEEGAAQEREAAGPCGSVKYI